MFTKTKYRSRLDTEVDLYIQLSIITPDIKHLYASVQVHSSYLICKYNPLHVVLTILPSYFIYCVLFS